MNISEPFLDFEKVLNQKGTFFDNNPRSFDASYNRLEHQIPKKSLPLDSVSFNNSKIIYSRREVKYGLKNLLAPKFSGSCDNWKNHYATILAKLSELGTQDFCEWFISESFKNHTPDLRLLNDGSIYVVGGNHRVALLDVLNYNGLLDIEYFKLQNG